MFEYIEKLRQKPARTKKQIAFLSALFVAGLIFVVWLSVIYPDFKQGQQKEDAVAKLEPSPLSTFGETISTGLSAIGEQFGKLKESVTTMIASPALYNAASTTPSDTPITTPIFIEATSTLENPNDQIPISNE